MHKRRDGLSPLFVFSERCGDRTVDVAAVRARTFTRQTYGAEQPEDPAILQMPQAGYVMERKYDFIFRDDTGRLWYRLDEVRYERIARILRARRDNEGQVGIMVLCIRPTRLPQQSDRVEFPDTGDAIGNGYTVEYLEPSDTRVSYGFIVSS